MKLVVGLGNPEPEYSFTRHNVGKDFLNYYLEPKNFRQEPKFHSFYYKKDGTIFIKPDLYMNDSGKSVSRISNFYKLELQNICVIYDDLDLVVGNSKLSRNGSRIHNGVNSIVEELNTNLFWHLRIGVREEKINMSVQKFGLDPKAYVLAKFGIDDRLLLENHFSSKVNKLLDSFLNS